MTNRIEEGRSPEQHMMTQFTREVLERQLSDLQEKYQRHKREMGAAIDKGDEYHDNSAYDEASRLVDVTSSMLSGIEQRLSNIVIIEPRQEVDTIGIGNSVILRFKGEEEDETFTILGPDDATQNPGWISYESPLGSRLLGKKPGDKVEYQVPREEPQRILIKEVLPGLF